MATLVPNQLDACWSRIGVQGDGSCPTLTQAVHCRNCQVFAAAGQVLFDRDSPPDYVAHWTRQLAEAPASSAAATLPLLVFRIAGEWLAMDACSLVEIVEPRRIHRVPHRTDRHFLGLANIRGELQLCVSLREVLGIGEPGEGGVAGNVPDARSGSPPRLLVAHRDRTRWVFPVDEVEGVHRIPETSLEDLPHTVAKSARFYCRAVFSHCGKRVGLLAETRLFDALERIIG